MPFVLLAPVVILALTLTTPFAYRFVWPRTVTRSGAFFGITLSVGLIIAIVAIFWFLAVLNGVGISRPSGATAAASARFESVMRFRFGIAAVLAVLAQYLVCRFTQGFLGR